MKVFHLHDKYGKPKKVSKKDLKNLSLEISEVLNDSTRKIAKIVYNFMKVIRKVNNLSPRRTIKKKEPLKDICLRRL